MTAQNATAGYYSTTTTTTQTIEPHTQNPSHSSTQTLPTLRLHAETSDGRRIRWAEDVIDNEGVGKKSSKVCCIYHKTRAVGESSSDNDSDDSSSSSDEDASDNNGHRDDGKPRMGGEDRSKGRHKDHSHVPSEGCGGGKAQRTRKSPNAYEKMPKSVV